MHNVPTWDQYFEQMTRLVASKSKDRGTRFGAVIVGSGMSIISTGYNGFPRGINDDKDERHERPAKYQYTEHAERNAIYNAAREGIRTNGATMYVNGRPCADCARAIIQAGIVELVITHYILGKDPMWEESCRRGEEMMLEAGIRLRTPHFSAQPENQ